MNAEVWKDIEGYEGIYQVSNLGRVKSLPRKLWNGSCFFVSKEKILKAGIDNVGYPTVSLHGKDKRAKSLRVHRLVAKAFIPNPNNYHVVNHIDGGRTNNHVDNLEWCTHKHNIRYAVKMGRFDRYMRKVRVLETGKIYPNIHACAKDLSEYKADYRHISACLNGKLKSHAGFHYEEVKE
jgi:hypothetical protein